MLAIVATAALASCGKPAEPERFGRDLVMRASLPAEAIERFNAFVPETPRPGRNPVEALIANTESWHAPTRLRLSSNANPYVVAIRVTGRVTGDDGAVTLWLAGFDRFDAFDVPTTRTSPIAGLNAPKGGAKGDGRLERSGATAPVSFREDGDARPVVEIQRRSGLTLESVDVEVWSGVPNPTWREMLFGWQGALVGVAMFVFWWFAFRKRD